VGSNPTPSTNYTVRRCSRRYGLGSPTPRKTYIATLSVSALRLYCAHPLKGGLQHDAAHDMAAHDRLKQARKIVGLDPPPLKRSHPQEATP
jgi:hypothetical protein